MTHISSSSLFSLNPYSIIITATTNNLHLYYYNSLLPLPLPTHSQPSYDNHSYTHHNIVTPQFPFHPTFIRKENPILPNFVQYTIFRSDEVGREKLNGKRGYKEKKRINPLPSFPSQHNFFIIVCEFLL